MKTMDGVEYSFSEESDNVLEIMENVADKDLIIMAFADAKQEVCEEQ